MYMQDLLEVGIRIELFGMDKPDHTFNNESFYSVTPSLHVNDIIT
jgi:hypothetical protein